MSKKYAVIKVESNIVKNTIVWDGSSGWQKPAGTYLVESKKAGIGDLYHNEDFWRVVPESEEEEAE